ncbi:hypothetical protein V5O48_003143 [Marasmius crinis-equi]|uniref:Chromatin modification-related protein n=1 Tax=Marasmius crinis-equi TaxID=585013 RepID=A0ABR3FUR1_9AGAR
MNSVSAQNLEDAANIATEFIYSIENVPNEVKHLLEEILHKETKSQQLQQQIDSDSARWMKHSLRGNTPTSSLSASPSPSPSSSSKSVNHLPARIKHNYAEIDQIAAEKIALSQKMIELISRTSARLDVDLNKVRQLQGDIPDYTKTNGLSAVPTLTSVDMLRGSGGSTGGLSGRDPASSISESLRMALSSAVGGSASPISENTRKGAAGATESGTSSGTGTPATKRRRTAASPSIKLPPTKSRSISPAASGAGTTKAAHSRSRLSRQIHPPPPEPDMADEVEEDAEAEEEAEGEEDEDADDRLYCFCQKTSYGDMIACDNEGGCPYEWFHLSCVGLTRPVPDTWYCSVCSAKMGTSSSSNRKGRKK